VNERGGIIVQEVGDFWEWEEMMMMGVENGNKTQKKQRKREGRLTNQEAFIW
jgi:hypothetical protein